LSKIKPSNNNQRSPRARAHPIKKSFSKKLKKIISKTSRNNQDFNENGSYKSLSSGGYSSSVSRLDQLRFQKDIKQKSFEEIALLRVQLSETMEENSLIKTRLHMELKERHTMDSKNKELNDKLMDARKGLQETGTALFKLQQATDQLMNKRDQREVQLQKAQEINRLNVAKISDLEARLSVAEDGMKFQTAAANYRKLLIEKEDIIHQLEDSQTQNLTQMSKLKRDNQLLVDEKKDLESILESRQKRISILESHIVKLNEEYNAQPLKILNSTMFANSSKLLKDEPDFDHEHLNDKFKDMKLLEKKLSAFDKERKVLEERMLSIESQIVVNTSPTNTAAASQQQQFQQSQQQQQFQQQQQQFQQIQQPFLFNNLPSSSNLYSPNGSYSYNDIQQQQLPMMQNIQSPPYSPRPLSATGFTDYQLPQQLQAMHDPRYPSPYQARSFSASSRDQSYQQLPSVNNEYAVRGTSQGRVQTPHNFQYHQQQLDYDQSMMVIEQQQQQQIFQQHHQPQFQSQQQQPLYPIATKPSAQKTNQRSSNRSNINIFSTSAQKNLLVEQTQAKIIQSNDVNNISNDDDDMFHDNNDAQSESHSAEFDQFFTSKAIVIAPIQQKKIELLPLNEAMAVNSLNSSMAKKNSKKPTSAERKRKAKQQQNEQLVLVTNNDEAGNKVEKTVVSEIEPIVSSTKSRSGSNSRGKSTKNNDEKKEVAFVDHNANQIVENAVEQVEKKQKRKKPQWKQQ